MFSAERGQQHQSLRSVRGDCPVCASRRLMHSVSFDALPVLCNALHGDHASALAAVCGRFELTYCNNCGHLFNAAFDEDQIGYTQSYENSLHFSQRFNEFAISLCQRLGETYRLKDRLVVDVGCGKGDFLNMLCGSTGARGIGFDKSFGGARGTAAELGLLHQ